MKKVEISDEIFMNNILQMLKEGHSVTMQAKGVSMRPFIEYGRDSVILYSCEELKVGDIVLAEVEPKKHVLHRLIRKKGDLLILMGDGNVKGVEKCKSEDVIGIAKFIIRDGKKIDCNSRKWRIYSRIWRFLRPLRRYLLAIYRRIFL